MKKPLSLFSTFSKIYTSARGSRSREFSCNNLILSIVRELNKTNRILAIQFAEKYQPLAEDERFVKTLAELYLRNGKPVLALNVLSKFPDSKRDQRLLEKIETALEFDVGNTDATLHFIKHNREVRLNSSGYSLVSAIRAYSTGEPECCYEIRWDIATSCQCPFELCF